MNRFGKLFLGILLLAVIAFVSMTRINRDAAPETTAPDVPPATDAAEVLPSGLVMPVTGARGTQLHDMFGDARGERTHGAIDIMASKGAPVVAALGGTVEKIHESELGGHTVYVRSADERWITYYAHLDSYAPGLREGLPVAQGQAIGSVGSTGNASPDGPHLHFEVKRMSPGETWSQGQAVNPYPLLTGG